MTSITDPRSGSLASGDSLDNLDTGPRQPPTFVVGPLAWMRRNLFRTPFDTVLTLVGGLAVISVITGLFNWIVTQANWYAIIFNLRLFMLGRYEPEYEWRVLVAVLLVAFALGANLAAWARVSRAFVVFITVVVLLTFIVPAVVDRVVPLPPAYYAAGEVEIVSGASAERPQPYVGFIARAGETISVRLADSLSESDAALRGQVSFADNATNLLRTGADNQLGAMARAAEIEALLARDASAGPLLTANQREALSEELEALEIPPSTVETYALNTVSVEVRVLDGASGEVLGEAVLEPGSAPLRVVVPQNGWYVLEKQVNNENAAALLETENIFPLLVRTLTRGEVLDENGEVVSAAGRVNQYVRLTDMLTIEAERPEIDGDDIPVVNTIDVQYRGDVRPGDYLRLFLSPFLAQMNVALLALLVVAAAGYLLSRAVDRFLSPREHPRRASRRMAVWLLTVAPFLGFIFIYGFFSILPMSDTRRWGGLMLTIMLTAVGIVASFPLGVLLALGRRSSLPVVSTICTVYIEFVRGVPLITVLFMAQLLVPLVNPALADIPNVFRAMVGITLFSAAYLAENVRGGLQSVPPGQEEAAKALGMQPWRVLFYITLPQALRAVIPALVGQFISLLKDTSLVAIVGLIDLTGVAEVVVAQTEFLGERRETYLFITLIYFTFSYAISTIARRIEASGVGAARRAA